MWDDYTERERQLFETAPFSMNCNADTANNFVRHYSNSLASIGTVLTSLCYCTVTKLRLAGKVLIYFGGCFNDFIYL